MECSLSRICVAFLLMGAATAAQAAEEGPFQAVRSFTQQAFYNPTGDEKAVVKNPNSLLAEIGPEMLTANYVFGGVITAVGDPTHEDMGNLKASAFPNFMSRLTYDQANNALNITACLQNCLDPAAVYEPVYQLPVLQRDALSGRLTVDFAQISDELDFVSYWTQAVGMPEKHVKLGSTVTLVDNSDPTALIFEIATTYNRQLPVNPYNYTVKTRWFIKNTAALDPTFFSRFPTNGVGFFQTAANLQPVKITRYSLTKPIHFYIKNVPTEYRQAFQDALEDWNTQLAPTLHIPHIITYEFLETSNPLFSKIVTGDIRYSVIEWDLDNLASYGGLGPSVASPATGQTFSSLVWIQGPTIEKLYKHWFNVQKQIEVQKGLGNEKAASDLMAEFYRSLPEGKAPVNKLGDASPFDFPALRPELYDPVMTRDDFELPPAGQTYDTYMYGYFRDMVAHEVGHNLGLRHNFRGNLAGNNSHQIGSVSRSVMEYLGKSFRYLDRVGVYDKMAINYGYMGTMPNELNWYCTDEDQFSSTNPANSAECSQSDATSDPFSYFAGNVAKVYGNLVSPGQTTASTWTIADLQSTLATNLTGVISYAVSAPYTSGGWSNFSTGGGGRPTNSSAIQTYVLNQLQTLLCPANEQSFITQKVTPADQTATAAKIRDYRKAAQDVLNLYSSSPVISTAVQLDCVKQGI